MNLIEISRREVRGLHQDLLVAIMLSAQGARLINHIPFTSWEESRRLAHEPGPAEALSRGLLLILDNFRNFNRERAWRVLGRSSYHSPFGNHLRFKLF
ncbi:hypothetical protein ASPCAL00754 [Aspergillus calidoustus]|uniref:Uncharacterized protein n=1 Tax=Aspergillus calidoustus TaxID=454130 RepID=A0A0U5FRD5_ASPCI|nr:hypothetical protein ASPCAL00754 [Aspergillus calidoustus]